MGAFRDFEGEIFVKGPISFEHWGAMKEGSVIHVPDEETGRKILESPGFYKKIAIYVGDDRPLEAQQEGMADKRLFEILGCPDYDKVLKPVEPGWGGRMPTVVTLLYNLPAKTTVQINAYCGEYMLDDGDVKKLKKGKTYTIKIRSFKKELLKLIWNLLWTHLWSYFERCDKFWSESSHDVAWFIKQYLIARVSNCIEMILLMVEKIFSEQSDCLLAGVNECHLSNWSFRTSQHKYELIVVPEYPRTKIKTNGCFGSITICFKESVEYKLFCFS
jgi:hypothetical protein